MIATYLIACTILIGLIIYLNRQRTIRRRNNPLHTTLIELAPPYDVSGLPHPLIHPHKCTIIPTETESGDTGNNTTCILLSDGSSRFSDDNIVVKTKHGDT